eukprot:CAMPEP_0114509538 /NCGR_PEP_ID=MMETSP0109-20121206/13270_1 /TAXON_ID=29199 /ORGANISM="Chlorarachnion reptans, Strain CCCM449" /LENGTH=475 /DNA_ID=CAMNT_0001688711 /DNA_START=57 /DNA_END=1484 /DNA_ORIENTATION=+
MASEAAPPSHLVVAVIGHVGSGKSSLCGRLILAFRGAEEKTVEVFRELARSQGKTGDEAYAWIVDQYAKEREAGQTFENSIWGLTLDQRDIATTGTGAKGKMFKGPSSKEGVRHFTLIDSPGGHGHDRRVHDACAQADAVIVVVSAVPGEYEACLGQLRQYATAAMTVGIKSFIVAVSKMDHPRVSFSCSRFEQISKFLRGFFQSRLRGVRPPLVIPFSSKVGVNISKKVKGGALHWYNGPCLLGGMVTALKPDLKRIGIVASNKPLRFTITRAFRLHGAGTIALGRVESGILKVGQRVLVSPGGVRGQVASIQQHYKNREKAFPGDLVGVALHDISVSELKRGFIIGEEDHDPPIACKSFVAQVLVVNQPYLLREGAVLTMDVHNAHIPVKILKIQARVKIKPGSTDIKELNIAPKALKPTDRGNVTILPLKPVSLEVAKMYSHLGRFALRGNNMIMAVGVVIGLEVFQKYKKL